MKQPWPDGIFPKKTHGSSGHLFERLHLEASNIGRAPGPKVQGGRDPTLRSLYIWGDFTPRNGPK